MKISLISTSTYPGDQGLRVISSCLKKAGHEVQMIFMVMEEDYSKVYSLKVLRQLGILCKDSDLVGISCMASTSIRASQIINYVKEVLEKPVVLGGVHATISPESCVKKADYVIVGEGEEAIVELANKLEKKQKVDKIKNLWTKKFRNPVRKLVENLDKFPFPDFDIENHYILDKNIRKFKERDFHGMIFYQTERGCPHSCTYCINRRLKEINKGKGKVLRTNSVNHIIKDLVRLKKKFPNTKTFDIRDETFFVRDYETIKKFCSEYKKKVGLRWKCLASPMNMDEKKLNVMINAGMTDIIVGIQGSERSNFEVYKRYIKNEDIMKCAKILNKYKRKIAVMYDVITCNPYENKEDIVKMIRFLQKLPKPYYLSVNNLVFFLGSELYTTARKDGIIKEEIDSAFNLNYWDRWKHIKLKRKNEYLVLILNLMRGVSTKRRFGLMPDFLINFLLKKKRVEFHLKHKRMTYFAGSIIGVGDFFREHVLKPTYRSLPTGFKSWYDKVRYRV